MSSPKIQLIEPVREQSAALYYRTRYGSIVERQSGPDVKGWMTVMRLSDGAIREWNVADMTPVPDEEVLALAKAELS